MRSFKMSAHAGIIWRIRALILAAAAEFLTGGLFAFVGIYALITGVLLAGVYLFFCLKLIPDYRKNAAYNIYEEYIHIAKGIFFMSEKRIPIGKIQYAVTVQSPLQSALKISNCVLYMAGGREIIPCVDEENAKNICEMLAAQGAAE